MKKGYIIGLIAAVFFWSGCGSDGTTASANGADPGTSAGTGQNGMSQGGGQGGAAASQFPADVTDALNAPKSVLTQAVKDSLTYMYSEEGLAHDVYLAIYDEQPANQLQNIATRSEVNHIAAVDALAVKYDLNMTQYPDTDIPYDISGIGNGQYPVEHIQELYDVLYAKGIQSRQDALEVGCMVEVVDIVDLDRYITEATESNAPDVLSVFTYLRDGSYNHYRAFDKGLKNMGISDGCCAVSDYDGLSFCHPEYLQ